MTPLSKGTEEPFVLNLDEQEEVRIILEGIAAKGYDLTTEQRSLLERLQRRELGE
jgi:hypothetical protein